jgi:8-oxo-dGTP pyrophosphatase MutT (NUDIX family)
MFDGSNGRLDAGALEEDIGQRRDRLSASPGLLSRPKFRLAAATTSDGAIHLALGPTDYFDYLATNHDEALNRTLVEKGKEERGDPDAFLSNAIGNVAVLTTTDGDIAMLRRGGSVATFSGYLDLPGGHPEPENVRSGVPEGVGLTTELYSSILSELEEEVGIGRGDIVGLDLIGVVRSFADGRKPEMIFHAASCLNSAAVREAYLAVEERDESVDLILAPPAHFLGYRGELTVPTLAALEILEAMTGDESGAPAASFLGAYGVAVINLDAFGPLSAPHASTEGAAEISALLARTGQAREIILTVGQEPEEAEVFLRRLNPIYPPLLLPVTEGRNEPGRRHEAVLRHTGVSAPECLAVERDPREVEAASQLGFATVAVGFESEQATWSIGDLDELW